MKQMIVMRKDLNMRKGKMVAQGAHASLATTLKFLDHEYVVEWLNGNFTKITVYVNSEEQLQEIHNLALLIDLPTVMITDAGRTEFNGVPTNTCIAVGPGPDDQIDLITGDLKLL